MDRVLRPGISHALPIAYHLSGFSMHMKIVCGIIHDLLDECVKLDAFDGKFSTISNTGDDGTPLTLLQLQKRVWEKANQIKNADHMTNILSMCGCKSLHKVVAKEVKKLLRRISMTWPSTVTTDDSYPPQDIQQDVHVWQPPEDASEGFGEFWVRSIW